MLVNSAVSGVKAQLKPKRGVSTPEERLETFQHLFEKGEKQKAVRFLSEREEVTCVLDPDRFDENTGQTIRTRLASHPITLVNLVAAEFCTDPCKLGSALNS